MANYDITIRTKSGKEMTFYGSRFREDGDTNVVGYQELEGLGEPTRRTTSTVKSGADGTLIAASDQQYEARTISFTAFLWAESLDKARQLKARLREAFPIREEVLVLVATPTGEIYGANAVITTCTATIAHSDGTRWVLDVDIDLTCPDPYLQDYTAEHANEVVINKVTAGGLAWADTALEWIDNYLAWSEGGSVPTVTNNGEETVYPLITISGATTNPIISNLTTGEQIKVPMALTADDVFEIDMDEETLKLNGQNMSNVIIDDAWWGLITGVNRLEYTSSSQADTATVTLSWRDRYLEAL